MIESFNSESQHFMSESQDLSFFKPEGSPEFDIDSLDVVEKGDSFSQKFNVVPSGRCDGSFEFPDFMSLPQYLNKGDIGPRNPSSSRNFLSQLVEGDIDDMESFSERLSEIFAERFSESFREKFSENITERLRDINLFSSSKGKQSDQSLAGSNVKGTKDADKSVAQSGQGAEASKDGKQSHT